MLQRSLPAGFVVPCLPSKTDRLPSGSEWLHEIKHDGFRVIARNEWARKTIIRRIRSLIPPNLNSTLMPCKAWNGSSAFLRVSRYNVQATHEIGRHRGCRSVAPCPCYQALEPMAVIMEDPLPGNFSG